MVIIVKFKSGNLIRLLIISCDFISLGQNYNFKNSSFCNQISVVSSMASNINVVAARSEEVNMPIEEVNKSIEEQIQHRSETVAEDVSEKSSKEVEKDKGAGKLIEDKTGKVSKQTASVVFNFGVDVDVEKIPGGDKSVMVSDGLSPTVVSEFVGTVNDVSGQEKVVGRVDAKQVNEPVQNVSVKEGKDSFDLAIETLKEMEKIALVGMSQRSSEELGVRNPHVGSTFSSSDGDSKDDDFKIAKHDATLNESSGDSEVVISKSVRRGKKALLPKRYQPSRSGKRKRNAKDDYVKDVKKERKSAKSELKPLPKKKARI